MRFFCYPEYAPNDPRADEQGGFTVVLSEEDIRREYWPYWYGRMCEKFEQAYVDINFTFEDCLYDWMVVHWGYEVSDGHN